MTDKALEAAKWPEPPEAVWVWGKYRKYDETYCDPNEINQAEFEVPVTKYIRADLASGAPVSALPGEAEVVGLVERLRTYRPANEWGDPVHHTICDEAASRLLSLASQKAEYAEALKLAGRTIQHNITRAEEAESSLRRLQSASQSQGVEDGNALQAMQARAEAAYNEGYSARDEVVAACRARAEASEARVKELEEALEPFADVADHDIGLDEEDADIFRPMSNHNRAAKLTVGDLRRARTALKGGSNG